MRDDFDLPVLGAEINPALATFEASLLKEPIVGFTIQFERDFLIKQIELFLNILDKFLTLQAVFVRTYDELGCAQAVSSCTIVNMND